MSGQWAPGPSGWVDSHCHLADPRIESEAPRLIAEAEQAGIVGFVQGGVDPEDWSRQLRLKERFPGRIATAFGLHPWWVATHSREDVERGLKELGRLLPRADALGEIGLDFAPRFDKSTHELQGWALAGQLELSREQPDRPLVLHVVRAHGAALEGLKGAGRRYRGLVHSFSGSHEVARQYLDLGFHLSISGVITRKGFETLRRAVRYIPGDRLLIETDSPDQAPRGWEKPWNEPSSLPGIAQAVAGVREEKAEEILLRSRENLRKLFFNE